MRFRILPLLALATALLVPADRPGERQGAGERRGERDGGPYPSDWFGLQRAWPLERIPQGAFAAALARARADRADLAGALADRGAGRQAEPSGIAQSAALDWQQAGPYNIGGRVTALAVTPGGTTLYLGAANGGVWKSVNSGVNWSPVFQEPYSIGALTLQPGNPSVIYAGTGEANSSVDSYDGAGLFKSSDAGASWSSLGLAATARIARVAVDPQNTSRIFVAAMGTQFSTGPDRGLYRSENGGQTWTKVLFVSDSTGASDVAINPAHPETVYCATWERVRHYTYRRAFGPETGIWRSVDHGTSWTRLSTGLPPATDNVGRIGLGIAPSRPSTIYAQIGSGLSGGYVGLGFYRSTDGGATWTQRNTDAKYTDNFGGFVWYFGDMAVDPVNPDVVYSLGVDLIRSADAGATWAYADHGSHVDFHALWINPANTARLYSGNDGGFYWSTTTGGTWTATTDLPITQFYAGSVDPSDPTRLVGGAQDNGCLISLTGPTNWGELPPYADGFYMLVDPTDPDLVFTEMQFCGSDYPGVYFGPLRTVGGAQQGVPSGLSSTDRFNWCTPFVMDPSNHNVLLVGSQRVYKSTNNGLSYAAVSGDLTNFNPASQLTYNTITTLDISPHNPNVYYAGTDDGRVWRSLDAGTNWTNVSAGLPVRYVTRVTADPGADSTVYVTLSGFGQDEHLSHVFRSVNAGNTWTSISGNLADVPANDLLVDPVDRNTLYLGTDVGVYVTRNLGGYWFTLGQGMPIQAVLDLTLHPASRTLVAATHGRSQWKLDLSGWPAGVGSVPPARHPLLSAPWPNPSRAMARFDLDLAAPGRAEVAVFDAAGRRVRALYSGFAAAGRMSLSWDGFDESHAHAPAGIYFVRATAGGVSESHRLVRVR